MKPHDYLTRHQNREARRRRMIALGVGLLLAGYAILSISPDTPAEWVLLRVSIGFGLLFLGFVIAILPLFLRLTRSED